MFFLSFIAQVIATVNYWALTSSQPLVTLPYGTFAGIESDDKITQFLGIPFARPPLGDLRFRHPQPPVPFEGLQQATAFGAACAQQLETYPPGINFTGSYSNISEDCLTINVVKPTTSVGASPLPVIFWIHGGGFEIGDSTDTSMLPLIKRSIEIDRPIMAVIANHRLNGFGFLAGQEVEREGLGNLGLHDQRFALKWVQQHIGKFGGDPTKVVIAGVSAGAISAAMQLLANDGDSENLFRGAFMESGSAYNTPSVASGQDSFDQIARFSNCSSAVDPLHCLRQVPFDILVSAINQTRNLFQYSSLANEWKPRVDGKTWRQNALCAVSRGLYAKVPLMSGNCDDEGTLFSLVNLNVTTNTEFLEYINSYYLQGATEDDLIRVGKAYPEDPTFGSPFDTGNNNTLTPEFKRLAAIQGDLIFQGPRRLLLQHASTTQTTWSFLNKRGKFTPTLGSVHASDMGIWFARNTTDFSATDYLIHFVNYLNPNDISEGTTDAYALYWPSWSVSGSGPSLLTFYDGPSTQISTDTFRSDSISLLNDLQLSELKKQGLCSIVD